MKKYLSLLMLFFLIIDIPFMVKAKECSDKALIIKSITAMNKTDDVVELEESNITNNIANINIKMINPGDNIKYKLVVKNNYDKKIDLEKTLNVNSSYLDYIIDYEDNSSTLNPNSNKNIYLTIKYKNAISGRLFENGIFKENKSTQINSVLKNPNTGYKDFTLVLILISSTFITILLKEKKDKNIFILVLVLTTFIPLTINAVCNYKLNLNINVQIEDLGAKFDTGINVNIKMKQLAGTDTSTNGESTIDQNIKAILMSTVEPSDTNKENENLVSASDSPYPIYMWYDNETIYWWSKDKNPALNENSSNMFSILYNLSDMSGLRGLDTSTCISMFCMFTDDLSITNLNDLSNWDVSNVENMQSIFYAHLINEFGKTTHLNSLEGLSKWNVSKVKNMNMMFNSQTQLTSLKGLENWDVSSVKTMGNMFFNSSLTTLEGLESWNTSSVTNMSGVFGSYSSSDSEPKGQLKDISALSNWDTSKVVDMSNMFRSNIELTTLDGLEKWNTSNVKNLQHFCYQCTGLTDVSALKDWNTSKVTNMNYMFYNNKSLTTLKGLENWDTSKVEGFEWFCTNCTSLINVSEIKNWDTSSATTMKCMFLNCTGLKEIDFSNFDMSKITSNNNAVLVQGCIALERLKTPKIYPLDSSVNINLQRPFYDASNNKYYNLNNTSPTQTWLTRNN